MTIAVDSREDGRTFLARQGQQLQSVPVGTLIGVPPAILLWDPKYPHNVGAAVRAASCYGIGQVWMTGRRVPIEADEHYRLPREERMRGYADVQLVAGCARPFEQFKRWRCPFVAVEVRDNAESLVDFEHPQDAVYCFGPEDGSLPNVALRHAHRFVRIPTRHCLNLAAAINVVLYDRQAKAERIV